MIIPFVFIIFFVSSLSHSAFSAGMARPIGMGGAFIAVSDDVNGIYENPAGFCFGKGQELGLYYSGLSEGAAGGIGYRYTFGDSAALGVAVLRNIFSSFYYDYQDRYAYIAYSQKIFSNFSLGMNVKGEQIRIDTPASMEAVGYTADIGLLYKLNSSLSLGLVLQNALKTTFSFNNGQEYDIDRAIEAGVAWRPMGENLLLAFDLTRVPGSFIYNFGVEGKVTEPLVLRGGVSGATSELAKRSFFVGLGFYMTKDLVIDLAVGANSTTGSFSWLF